MKITLHANTKQPPSLNIIKDRIQSKLDLLLNNQRFFRWAGSDLISHGCANVGAHNKIVILLAIFTDSNNPNFNCHTSFCDGIRFANIAQYDLLVKLDALLESIETLKDVTIEIS